MKIIKKETILDRYLAIPLKEHIEAIAQGFVSYSHGKANIPPVGHLKMTTPPGDIHIKYGAIDKVPNYVIKIASGFYDNPSLGVPSSNGMMLAFNAQTGEPNTILLDEGFLTDIRTGLAGAVCAKYVGPKVIQQIGIVGTGIQARYQLKCLEGVSECKKVKVWGRNKDKAMTYQAEMEAEGYSVEIATNLEDLATSCNLIVTTTPSNTPLINGDWILPGTHITAVGSDTPGKRELDKNVLSKADHVIADSISQCLTQGEIQYEKNENVIELGDWITNKKIRNETDITICDLTGVAVQDIVIANSVIEKR